MLYSVITIVMFVGYGYCAFKAHFITMDLRTKADIKRHWNGRIILELKRIYNNTDDLDVKAKSKKAIGLIKTSYYIAYCGLGLFLILMILGYY